MRAATGPTSAFQGTRPGDVRFKKQSSWPSSGQEELVRTAVPWAARDALQKP